MLNNNTSKLDLKKRAYIYALDIIQFIDHLDKKDYGAQIISKQLLRSATSIGANIIEAQAGSSKKDFTNFFSYALKSANESKFWLGILRDSGKTDKNRANKFLQETIELSNILGSSILTLKGRQKS
ncbi:MAG: four helix bundle protein [Candidatus Niyogibacteria bacterium]|nr:four helix bundle protein [Candidatus Niyogibacteria bacterium]